MRILASFCLIYLLSSQVMAASPAGVLFGGTSKKKSRRTQNGFNITPFLGRFKGFEFSKGLIASFDYSDSKDSRHSFNYYYSTPEIKGFSSYEVTQMKFEYENRSFDSPSSYYSAAMGMQTISPNLNFKNYYKALGQESPKRTKPYLAFRMGYKVMDSLPVVQSPAILEMSYTISDDYRFPSNGPNGYRKIPLKGFGAAVSFKF